MEKHSFWRSTTHLVPQGSVQGSVQGSAQGSVQGSVLGPLLFLIYINDLPYGIITMCKIFADDTSLFSKVLEINKSVTELKGGLSAWMT